MLSRSSFTLSVASGRANNSYIGSERETSHLLLLWTYHQGMLQSSIDTDSLSDWNNELHGHNSWRTKEPWLDGLVIQPLRSADLNISWSQRLLHSEHRGEVMNGQLWPINLRAWSHSVYLHWTSECGVTFVTLFLPDDVVQLRRFL